MEELNLETFTLIETYYQGQLSPEAEAAFIRQMETDPTFRQQVSEVVQTLEGLDALRLQEIQAQLPAQNRVRELPLWTKVAAGLIFLAGALGAWTWYQITAVYSSQAIVEAHYQADLPHTPTRSFSPPSNSTTSPFQERLLLKYAQTWEDSIRLLQQVRQSDTALFKWSLLTQAQLQYQAGNYEAAGLLWADLESLIGFDEGIRLNQISCFIGASYPYNKLKPLLEEYPSYASPFFQASTEAIQRKLSHPLHVH